MGRGRRHDDASCYGNRHDGGNEGGGGRRFPKEPVRLKKTDDVAMSS